MNEAVCAVVFLLALVSAIGFFAVNQVLPALLCGIMATVAFVGTAIIGEMKRLARKAERDRPPTAK